MRNQSVFYKFQCNLWDADYVGDTTRHLRQRISEHKYLAIDKHIEEHGLTKSALEDKQFSIWRNADRGVIVWGFEMLFIKEWSPVIYTQKGSIRANFLLDSECKYFIFHIILVLFRIFSLFSLHSCLKGILSLYLNLQPFYSHTWFDDNVKRTSKSRRCF